MQLPSKPLDWIIQPAVRDELLLHPENKFILEFVPKYKSQLFYIICAEGGSGFAGLHQHRLPSKLLDWINLHEMTAAPP
jgi:hypothetical protein